MSLKAPILLMILSALGVPAGLAAQDEPFLGIWELNLAVSSITRGAPPRIETIVNIGEPGGFRSMLAVVGEKSTALRSTTTTSTEVSTRQKARIPGNFLSNASTKTRSSRIPAGVERSPFIGKLNSPETARR
jgi:hypothetical protein